MFPARRTSIMAVVAQRPGYVVIEDVAAANNVPSGGWVEIKLTRNAHLADIHDSTAACTRASITWWNGYHIHGTGNHLHWRIQTDYADKMTLNAAMSILATPDDLALLLDCERGEKDGNEAILAKRNIRR